MSEYNPASHAVTVAQVAEILNLKPQTNGKWHGAPSGTNATKDGFILCPEGNAFTNGGDTFTSAQVAELAGIAPDEYEPCATFAASNGNHKPSNAPQVTKAPKVTPEPKDAPKKPKAPFSWEKATIFPYRDETGDLLFEVGRCDAHGCEKSIRQRVPKAGGGYDTEKGCMDGVRRVLWHLRDVMEAQSVFIVEGEKCATALNEALNEAEKYGDYVATTNPQGALKWDKLSDFEALQDKHVIVLPDNDLPDKDGVERGRKHAAEVCAAVAGTAQRVQVLELLDLPEKGDIADFLEAGGTIETLFDLMESAPDWTPEETQPDATKNPFIPVPIDEILQRPRPLWLVQDIFMERGTGLITGRAGSFKSINAVDMGLCVSLGRAWQGHNVKQGRVVYVVAEGADTTTDRVKAWKIRHQTKAAPDFFVIEIPAQIADDNVRALFLEGIGSIGPALVVFDTLAQCNAGRNENDSGEMSVFTNAMKEISMAFNCFVLAIHHNNKNDTMRGSTSIENNTDAHISFKPSADKVVTVHCERIKNSDFDDFSLIGRFVEIGEQDEYGREVKSLVFEPTATPEKANTTTTNERECLEVLPSRGALSDEWWQMAKGTGISKTTFYRCRDNLRDKKQVDFDNKAGIYRPCSPSPI